MSEGDGALLARQYALEHIRQDVERGISEAEISLSRHGHACDRYWADVGLCQTYKPGGRNWPPTKVVISQINGKECLYVFSLHELYEEVRRGQLALL